MGGLEGRDDPFALGQQVKGFEGRIIVDRGVGRPAAFLPLDVLRPHRGIVEPGRHRVGAKDLAVLVLEDQGLGAVQDSGRGTRREPRGVLPRLQAPPSGFDAHQGHRFVADERGEDSGRVGAAADARNHHVGQALRRPLELGQGLATDHRLEIANHHRIGVGAEDRTEDVVRGADIGHPVRTTLSSCSRMSSAPM